MKKGFEEEYFRNYGLRNGKRVSYAENFFPGNGGNRRLKEVREKILKHRKGGKFLDVGCAYGHYLKAMEKEFEVYGIDVSTHAVKEAGKKGLRNVFALDAAKKWPFKEKFFDVILMEHSLEHFREPKKSLEQAARCLKDGGLLFVDLPTKLFQFPRFLNWERERIESLNRKLFNLRIGEFRVQFNPDRTHCSVPWPWEVGFGGFFRPHFRVKESKPKDFLHKFISAGYELVLEKSFLEKGFTKKARITAEKGEGK